MSKMMALAALAILVAFPALAATEYYVAHRKNTRDCVILETKPDKQTMVQVGRRHKTKERAEAALKADIVCSHKPNGSAGSGFGQASTSTMPVEEQSAL